MNFRLNPQKRGAYLIYLMMIGGESLFLSMIFTVSIVYHVTAVGLDPLQLVLVGTVLESSVLLFEIPTGVIADVYSRRLSIIIGYALMGVGFIIEGALPFFIPVLLAQVVWGFGYTFTSGAREAWLVDEIGEEKAAPAFLRSSQVGQITGLIGIAIGALSGSIVINLPILLGGLGLIGMAIFLLLAMPEQGFQPVPPEERESWRMLFGTLREGVQLVRVRPVLITILLISVVYGAASEGFDRLWTAHILENFMLPAIGNFGPVIWFGIINAVSMLLSLVTTEAVRRRIDLNNQTAVVRTIRALYALMIAAIVVFALSGNLVLALAAFWVSQALNATSQPLLSAWINRHIESKVRATVISMYEQCNAFGQIAGGPGVGFIGRQFSLRAALMASALLLTPVLPLFTRSMRQENDGQ